jgi:hypothetical protein
LVYNTATQMYKLQVESAARASAKAEAQVAKQRKQEADALTEAGKLAPDQVLSRAFSAFLKSGKQPRNSTTYSSPQIDFSKMVDFKINPPSLAEQKMAGPPGQLGGTMSIRQAVPRRPQLRRRRTAARKGTKLVAKAKAEGKALAPARLRKAPVVALART